MQLVTDVPEILCFYLLHTICTICPGVGSQIVISYWLRSLALGSCILYSYEIHLFDFRNNVIACAKHFVGDGGTHRGINEGNTLSTYDNLERIHMSPYVDCISQGVSTVMASYSSWNGRKLHADRYLLTEILKDKLGFKVNNSNNLHFFSHRICKADRNNRLLQYISKVTRTRFFFPKYLIIIAKPTLLWSS